MRWRMVMRGGALLLVAARLLPGAAALGSATVAPATVASATVASAAGRWTAVNFPTRETADDYAVSCVSANSCYVAGAEGNSGFMHFDGSRLSALPSPPFGPQINSDLEDLACASTRFCMTVGDRGRMPATADRWNGSRWTVTSIPVHVPAGIRHAKFVIAGVGSVRARRARCVWRSAVGSGSARTGSSGKPRWPRGGTGRAGARSRSQ
jgi:hypothetical protein